MGEMLAMKPKASEVSEPAKVACKSCDWHGECEMDAMPDYKCPRCNSDVRFEGVSPLEERYLFLCKKELNLKLALKDIRALKKEAEDDLERLKAIGQIIFQW